MNVSTDEFTDKFIEWIESNGWFFCGTTKPYENNNEPDDKAEKNPPVRNAKGTHLF